MRNLSDEQYKSWVDAGSPTAAEQWPKLLRLRDLEAALREARRYIDQFSHAGVPAMLARIDAALSAASGEASGGEGDEDYRCVEAPNVDHEATAQHLVYQIARSGGGTKSERDLTWALDSARAEGIAVERERLRQALVSAYYQGGRTESEAQRCADAAINAGAKP